ncbi:unnamed protein product [Paramecium primaurelia]|uniref:Uncharacterized protein n=1 Tax=Paramecium primaurelia TaxID=5886 RepID=A0A8S1M669_PARPR|nr:unnamed protein product [Paramecium primaurelia]
MLNNKNQSKMTKSNFFNTPKVSIGMFSNQQSIISQLLSTKGKSQNKKHKVSKTTYEFQIFRADTPNSPIKTNPFKTKYHFNTLSQLTKLESNNVSNNIQQEKTKNQDTSSYLGDVSIRIRSIEDDQINKILKSLKLIGEQMTHNKQTQINQIIMQQWQNQLNQHCDKLIKILSLEVNSSSNFYQPSIHIDNQLQIQLTEERKNRLLVEEQTSKIIQSQEQQIKQYIETIKLLEQKLLNSM